MKNDFLDLAFECAKKAYEFDEVPIGAVIVRNGKVISTGFNEKEEKSTVLAHAELIAIKKAEEKLNNWRLDDCDIYVTLDPCPMCASAIKQARIKNVYSASNNADSRNYDIIMQIFSSDFVNPSVNLSTNLRKDESKMLLNSFFKKQRNK
jgi:tRNA(adenine34) deaminase